MIPEATSSTALTEESSRTADFRKPGKPFLNAVTKKSTSISTYTEARASPTEYEMISLPIMNFISFGLWFNERKNKQKPLPIYHQEGPQMQIFLFFAFISLF